MNLTPLKENILIILIPTNHSHIFLTVGMVPEILASKILPIPWSDHRAIYTVTASTIPKAHDPTWLLRDSLLKYQTHKLNIELALKEYLEDNSTPDISPLILWEAHKPVLRCICLRQATLFNRERKNLYSKLENDFNICYMAFQTNPSPYT